MNCVTRCLAIAAPDRLRLGVGAALADNWLVRRLPEFAAKHPGITIELVVVENEAPERTANLDVRILWQPAVEARASSTQRPLFREHVFPVCHPKLLPTRFAPCDPTVLMRVPLLHKQVAARARNGRGRRGTRGTSSTRSRRKRCASHRSVRPSRLQWPVAAPCWRGRSSCMMR